jgi:hypothetical protein
MDVKKRSSTTVIPENPIRGQIRAMSQNQIIPT